MMPRTSSQMPPASTQEVPHEMPVTPMARPQLGYGYESGEQYMQALAQQVAPRVASMLRYQTSIPTPGQRLALAIVSLALMIPLIAIVVGSATIMASGLIGWLIAVGLICVTVMVVNIVYNGGIFTRG